ncbi:MAG TPA: HAD family hydrolase [Ohtaekwangia sp.]|nr:HAD family hydrolase [Ohtaekwangia sp.]
MIISFDLDDTLIPGTKQFDTEQQNLIQKLTGIEKIRKGTIGLFKELRSRGHSIYIYTTSLRPTFKANLTFRSYGIPVDRIINQQCHDRELKENKTRCSKFPPAFGIDIHVDDSPGLKIEGERFNFRTIIISEGDLTWTDKVLKAM